MTTLEFSTRLFLALLLGAAVGIERQWRQKSAGLRTNTLVSMGSAAFILLSVSLTGASGDPSRVASQIVTGIGFLGAGVIMKDGLSIHGLNTAATIWCSAAIGSLCGVGLFAEASILSAATILTHLVLRPLGVKLSTLPFLKSETSSNDYVLVVQCKTEAENHVRVLLVQTLEHDERVLLKSLSSDNGNAESTVITAEIKTSARQDSLMKKIAGRLTIEDRVMKVSWKMVGTHSDL
jgi:putative Mg2+ transporter-C (MgtC) family protein